MVEKNLKWCLFLNRKMKNVIVSFSLFFLKFLENDSFILLLVCRRLYNLCVVFDLFDVFVVIVVMVLIVFRLWILYKKIIFYW